MQSSQQKWAAWLGTPFWGTMVVGTFPGCKGGVFRPVDMCMMSTGDVPFCPICREALLLELLGQVDLAFVAPAPTSIATTLGQVRSFSFRPRSLPGMGVPDWTLDGTALASHQEEILLETSLLGPGTHFLSASTALSTPFVRRDPNDHLKRNQIWNIYVNQSPPVANAGLDQIKECGTGPIVLDGSASVVDSHDHGTPDSQKHSPPSPPSSARRQDA